MSQEAVEVVRRSAEVFDTGDLDRWLEFFDPAIDWRAMEGAPDDVGEMRGTEAVRRYVQDWLDTFDNFTMVQEELLDVGHDRVLAVQRVTGRARLSGIETELCYAAVHTLRDGKIVRVREYRDRAEALEAVDLAG